MESKNVLITGCSSGMGLCAARALRDRGGYRVFASARRPESVSALKQEGFDALSLDLDDPVSIQQGITEVLERTEGKLYALFNNAGFAIPGAILDITPDMLHQQFLTNLYGPLRLIQGFLPHMLRAGQGRIINNGSVMGSFAMPFRGAYVISKFALSALSDCLRQELHGTPITVSVLNPGPVQTEFVHNARNIFTKFIDVDDSYFASTYEQMLRFAGSKAYASYQSPVEVIVKSLFHALENPNPKAHYCVGSFSRLFAFAVRFFPRRWLDRLARDIILPRGDPS